ncbi:MAG TPA: hypothetical protein VGP80_11435 [Gemmatimonadales bacterium]|nr:hypothetical protein [Gemmatimonadales bacterium]
MKNESATLEALIRAYAKGQVPFWTFHNSFIEGFVRLPERDSGWEQLNQAYRLVLVSAPDPVAPADQASGMIGESALRARLTALLESSHA